MKEFDLAKNLKPIRYHVLASVLFHFLHKGIHNEIKLNGKCTVEYLTKKLFINEKILNGILTYLKNEKYIKVNKLKEFQLTKKCEGLDLYKPWYDLLIGGYSNTFYQISDLLDSKIKYATRNDELVGIGSCGISKFDAIPMTLELISRVDHSIDFLIDFGCGDGSFLIELCSSMKNVNGIGLDPEQKSIDKGNFYLLESGLKERVSFIKGTINEISKLGNTDSELKNVCFIAAFVLQEVLEQTGEESIIEFLTKLFTIYPNAAFVIIEVDNKFNDREIFKNDLALSYYNPYFLLHTLTKQRLVEKSFWVKLFEKSGLVVNHYVYPSSNYDSLELKIGFLLTKKV
ncbi:MAG: hypothetical protein JNL75_05970 [Chitinophagales bacterium]|nr:hypothetical protein [Chitinophagales bacterium]